MVASLRPRRTEFSLLVNLLSRALKYCTRPEHLQNVNFLSGLCFTTDAGQRREERIINCRMMTVVCFVIKTQRQLLTYSSAVHTPERSGLIFSLVGAGVTGLLQGRRCV
jgi:hypothetical protein